MRPMLFALLAPSLVACNGPKDTCAASADAFYSTLKGQSWGAAFELLVPEHRKRFGSSERYEAVMGQTWRGARSFSRSVAAVSETKGGDCVARGTLRYEVKARGQQVESIEEPFAWILRRGKDGLWYVEQPGMEKVPAL